MMQNNRKPIAKAIIKGSAQYPRLKGEVLFYQGNHAVLVTAKIEGLPQNTSGFFGFHIHEGSSCAGKSFVRTGGHYDPYHAQHPFHAGDLPPLLSCLGSAYMTVKTDRFNIRDIIGRTVIIHSGADDFRTQPAGNAGEKIACGVIKKV